MTPESAIRNQICSWLSFQKCFCFVHDSVGIYDPKTKRFRSNTNRYRIKGVADVLGIWKGKFLAIEVKTKRNYPTPEQKTFLARVNAEGGIGFVARSIEDCILHLNAHQTHDVYSGEENSGNSTTSECGAV